MAEFLEECFMDRGRSTFGGACIGKGEFQQPNCLVSRRIFWTAFIAG
jgi:hypothetical protein